MFELVKGTQAASLYIAPGADDFAGLSHVAEKIQKDIESGLWMTVCIIPRDCGSVSGVHCLWQYTWRCP